MTFVEPLTLRLRDAFQSRIRQDAPDTPTAVVRTVRSIGGLEFEIDLAWDGSDVGLLPVVELYQELGANLLDVTEVVGVCAALDALTRGGAPAADEAEKLVAALRHGDGVPAVVQVARDGAGAVMVRDGAGASVLVPEPPDWRDRARVRYAAYLTGVSVAAYERAVKHARARTTGGVPLVERQLVKDRLVRLLAEIRLVRAACRDAALALEAGPAPEVTTGARDLAEAAARRGSRDLVQLLGAAGLTDGTDGPRVFRAAFYSSHCDITNCDITNDNGPRVGPPTV